MTKTQLKQLIREVVQEMTAKTIPFNGKQVDLRSIEIDGIDRSDYPDFSDAYITAAEYTDGTPLSDVEIEKLSVENNGLASELVHDRELYR